MAWTPGVMCGTSCLLQLEIRFFGTRKAQEWSKLFFLRRSPRQNWLIRRKNWIYNGFKNTTTVGSCMKYHVLRGLHFEVLLCLTWQGGSHSCADLKGIEAPEVGEICSSTGSNRCADERSNYIFTHTHTHVIKIFPGFASKAVASELWSYACHSMLASSIRREKNSGARNVYSFSFASFMEPGSYLRIWWMHESARCLVQRPGHSSSTSHEPLAVPCWTLFCYLSHGKLSCATISWCSC